MLPGIEDWLLYPGTALKMLQCEMRGKTAAKEAEKYRKKAEEKKKLEEVKPKVVQLDPPKKESIPRVEGEVVGDEYAVSVLVYDDEDGNFKFKKLKKTKPKTDMSMFDKKVVFDEKKPILSDDDIENLISYVIKDVRKFDTCVKDSTIRHCVLVILVITNKISTFDLTDHLDNNDPDAKLVVNALCDFLEDRTMLVGIEVNDLEQYVSIDQLKLIIDSLYNNCNWEGDKQFSKIVKTVKKGYKAKLESKGSKREFPVVADPILAERMNFNIGDILNIREPRIEHNVYEYLVYRFSEILRNEDHFMFTINGAVDCNNLNYNVNDIAQAVIKCTDMGTGDYCLYSIDLNTIVGNGFNLIVPTSFGSILQDVYVNIDKYPELVRKILTTNYKFNTNSNIVDMDLKAVMADQLSYPQIYRYYDFSNMYKHIKDMSAEDKNTLSNNLMTITSYNWSNVLGIGAIMPRFRFRDYRNPNTFTLVSDKNVRVQSSAWMSFPYGLYAKRYILGDPDYANANSEFVIDLEGNEIRFYIDKKEVFL